MPRSALSLLPAYPFRTCSRPAPALMHVHCKPKVCLRKESVRTNEERSPRQGQDREPPLLMTDVRVVLPVALNITAEYARTIPRFSVAKRFRSLQSSRPPQRVTIATRNTIATEWNVRVRIPAGFGRIIAEFSACTPSAFDLDGNSANAVSKTFLFKNVLQEKKGVAEILN